MQTLNIITSALIREVEGDFNTENEGNMTEARCHIVLKMEDGDMSQGIQETQLQKTEKARKQVFLYRLHSESGPDNTLI